MANGSRTGPSANGPSPVTSSTGRQQNRVSTRFEAETMYWKDRYRRTDVDSVVHQYRQHPTEAAFRPHGCTCAQLLRRLLRPGDRAWGAALAALTTDRRRRDGSRTATWRLPPAERWQPAATYVAPGPAAQSLDRTPSPSESPLAAGLTAFARQSPIAERVPASRT